RRRGIDWHLEAGDAARSGRPVARDKCANVKRAVLHIAVAEDLIEEGQLTRLRREDRPIPANGQSLSRGGISWKIEAIHLQVIAKPRHQRALGSIFGPVSRHLVQRNRLAVDGPRQRPTGLVRKKTLEDWRG